MPDIEIRSTTIDGTETVTRVAIFIGDNHLEELTDESLHLTVNVEHPGHWSLAAIQRAALQRIRAIVDDEIQRTTHIANQRPG